PTAWCRRAPPGASAPAFTSLCCSPGSPPWRSLPRSWYGTSFTPNPTWCGPQATTTRQGGYSTTPPTSLPCAVTSPPPPGPAYRCPRLGIGIPIGAHEREGEPLAVASATDSEVIQFFLGDPQGWGPPAFPGGDAARLRAALSEEGLEVFIHAPYGI